MKSKHEQLYTAVQDLLIELDIDPDKLKAIADNTLHHQISPKTARKLMNTDIVVEKINWKKFNKMGKQK